MRLSGRHLNDCLLQNSFQRNQIFYRINGTTFTDINIRTHKNQSNNCKSSTIINGNKTKTNKVTKNVKCLSIEHLHSNRILLFIISALLLLLVNVDAATSEPLGQQKHQQQQQLSSSPLTPCEPKVLEDLQVDPVSISNTSNEL